METKILKIKKEEYDLLVKELEYLRGIIQGQDALVKSCKERDMTYETFGTVFFGILENNVYDIEQRTKKFNTKLEELKREDIESAKELKDKEMETFFDIDIGSVVIPKTGKLTESSGEGNSFTA